jgi:hypothetical protein
LIWAGLAAMLDPLSTFSCAADACALNWARSVPDRAPCGVSKAPISYPN